MELAKRKTGWGRAGQELRKAATGDPVSGPWLSVPEPTASVPQPSQNPAPFLLESLHSELEPGPVKRNRKAGEPSVLEQG